MRAVSWKSGFTALAASFAVLLFSGCQSVAGSSSATEVRVIDASYNAPAVSVDIATSPIATNIAQATITNYAILGVGNKTAYIYATGSKTASASIAGSFAAGQQHSVYITDSGSAYTASLLTDQNTAAPSGYVAVRFLQQALTTGAVDIYFIPSGSTITDSTALLTDVAAGTVTTYTNIPTGTYTLVVTATGSTVAKYTSASMTLTSGAVRTMLVMDAQLTSDPPVTVVVGDDLD